MKTVKNYFSIMVVVLLSTLAFTACSSSDDDNNTGGDSTHDSAIIGSWGTTQTVVDEEMGNITLNVTMVFKSNGTGEVIVQALGVTAPAQSFKWSTKDGNKLYMTAQNPDTGKEETVENTYTVSGKSLTIKDPSGVVMTLTKK